MQTSVQIRCPPGLGASRAHLSTLCPECGAWTLLQRHFHALFFLALSLFYHIVFSLITVQFFSYFRLGKSLPQQGWAADRYLYISKDLLGKPCSSDQLEKPNKQNVLNYRVIESLRLEKNSKIIRSNHPPTTNIVH